MYSYEDRLRAVELYIKLGKRIGLTIRQLGYPTKNALLSWHREYEQRLDLPVGYVRQPRYSQARKELAVRHYLEHGRCIAATIKSRGYRSTSLLSAWLQELHPQERARVVGRSQELAPVQPSRMPSLPCVRDQQPRRRWLKSWACLEARCTSGRIICSATTHPHP